MLQVLGYKLDGVTIFFLTEIESHCIGLGQHLGLAQNGEESPISLANSLTG